MSTTDPHHEKARVVEKSQLQEPRVATMPWSMRIADSALSRYDMKNAAWHYTHGLLFTSIEQVAVQSGDGRYWQCVVDYVDRFIDASGNIRSYSLAAYNVDLIRPATLLFPVYEATGDERYRIAIDLIRSQLRWQPRTHEGGFWHKKIYPYQMWLDGIYMASVFYTTYGRAFAEPAAFDDVAFQIITIENHTRDAASGLLYHAWDESRQQRWASPQTGCSPHFWSRAVGWYMMALVDILERFPRNHAARQRLVEILQRTTEAVAAVQDPASGLWYQILDLGSRAGNYLEASGSGMFAYAMAKGVRLGYLDVEWLAVAAQGFQGLMTHLVTEDGDGLLNLHGVCSTAGLGGTPYRDGSFDYYVGEPVITNNLHGVGPLILAAVEMERAGIPPVPSVHRDGGSR
ncbi:MAG: glycoside hydrolase family 88 protein [Anaerolineae bacterium]|nr:glycoside hydrolase family 88 protein [Anaerolineae bacterium]MCB0254911.1 glycoside hydrolase family 88 protein [Anaerolineae bacterium]